MAFFRSGTGGSTPEPVIRKVDLQQYGDVSKTVTFNKDGIVVLDLSVAIWRQVYYNQSVTATVKIAGTRVLSATASFGEEDGNLGGYNHVMSGAIEYESGQSITVSSTDNSRWRVGCGIVFIPKS